MRSAGTTIDGQVRVVLVKVVRQTHVLTSELEGELVMLDPERSEYFGLDPIGRRIWELLAEPIDVPTIVDTLLDEYEVDHDRCSREVTELVDDLIDAGLVSPVPR